MKTMKRMLSVLLSVVMVLGLMVPAFATEEPAYTITINNSTSGYTYEAYQVFAGTLQTETKTEGEGENATTVTVKTLSNITWGSGVKDTNDDNSEDLLDDLKNNSAFNKTVGTTTKNIFADCETAADVAAALAENETAAITAAFADVVGDNLTTTKKTSTYSTNKYTITDLDAGYYFVKNASVPTTDSSYTEYMLQVVANVTATHKGTWPTVDKKIVEGTDKVTHNEAAMGELVNYEIVGTLPDKFDDYGTYFYKFSDTLSKGLTFYEDEDADSSIKVEVVNTTKNEQDEETETRKDVTTYFYKDVGTYSATNGTNIEVSIKDVKALNNVTGVTVNKDSRIVVTYSAKLNDKAVIAGDGNPNTVNLTYSNDPNHSGTGTTNPPSDTPTKPTPESTQPTGKTPDKVVKTYTTELTIYKVDEDTRPLTGAEFTLESVKLNKVVVTKETNFVVDNDDGTYYKLKTGAFTTTAPVTDESADDTSAYYDEDNIGNKFSATTTTTTQAATDTNEDDDDNLNIYSVTAKVDAAGRVTFSGLAAGTYVLKETDTPTGYNTMADKTIVITYNTSKEGDFNTSTANVSEIKVGNVEKNIFKTTIENNKGSILPDTGSIGTTVFYVIGGVMVVVAGVVLVTKKRVNK